MAVIDRRDFLKAGIATGVSLATTRLSRGDEPKVVTPPALLPAKADAVIFIWLPGGMAQTDLWDPKRYTPYRKGMKGSELLGTCDSIPTAADDIRIGAGLKNIASVIDRGTILR